MVRGSILEDYRGVDVLFIKLLHHLSIYLAKRCGKDRGMGLKSFYAGDCLLEGILGYQILLIDNEPITENYLFLYCLQRLGENMIAFGINNADHTTVGKASFSLVNDK